MLNFKCSGYNEYVNIHMRIKIDLTAGQFTTSRQFKMSLLFLDNAKKPAFTYSNI